MCIYIYIYFRMLSPSFSGFLGTHVLKYEGTFTGYPSYQHGAQIVYGLVGYECFTHSGIDWWRKYPPLTTLMPFIHEKTYPIVYHIYILCKKSHDDLPSYSSCCWRALVA